MRKAAAYRAEFDPAERMTDENGAIERERIGDCKNIVAETVGRVIRAIRSGGARCAKTSPGDSVYMMRQSQLRGEVIKLVSVQTAAGNQDEAAPFPPQSNTSRATPFSTSMN